MNVQMIYVKIISNIIKLVIKYYFNNILLIYYNINHEYIYILKILEISYKKNVLTYVCFVQCINVNELIFF